MVIQWLLNDLMVTLGINNHINEWFNHDLIMVTHGQYDISICRD